MAISHFSTVLVNGSAKISLVLIVLLAAACAKPDTPKTTEATLTDLQALETRACGEYLFDSALAVLERTTALMNFATTIHQYAAPDTNTFGWTQARFILQLESTATDKKPYDIIYFHGGGGDVGHAGNVDIDLVPFLKSGYDVWSVEYRRGWHAGSYDPCIPRDPFNATPEDLARFDTAVVWAREDARIAAELISNLSTDSLVLYGSSFGGFLALSTGPYGDITGSELQRLAGCCCMFGSMPPSVTPTKNVRTFLLHGETDPINGPDMSSLFGIGPTAKGGRAVFQELEPIMPAWLIMHPGGHNFGRLSGRKIVDLVERSVIRGLIEQGAYIRDENGINPAP